MQYPYFRILIVVLLFFSAGSSGAQTSLPDSLTAIAARVSKDSAAKLYVKVANIFTGVNSDSVRKYARIAQSIASPSSVALGDTYVQIGNSYHMENNVDSSLAYFNKALVYFKSIDNEKGIGKVYQSFGLVKRSSGDVLGSIEDNKKALAIYIKIGWDVGIVNTYNNIAGTYLKMGEFQEALKYGRGAFAGAKKLNDSIRYYTMMSEYGSKLAYVNKTDSALYYLRKAAPFLERNNMYNLLIPAYSNTGRVLTFASRPDPVAARSLLYRARDYTVRSGAIDNLRHVYYNLASFYFTQKDNDSAAYFFDKTINLIDSLNTQRAVELTQEIETKYETEKKELLLQKQAVELDAKEKEARTRDRQLLLGALALLAIAVFAVFAYINFIKAKKLNRIINDQKQEVEKQKDQISHQKELIEEKQKEIIDSITYAKRIQQAVLTGSDVWQKIAAEHFILFRPKDIVSGDFYWAYVSPEGISVFALADCTGHGVPGGFMSMLGNSFLNDIVVENKIYKPGQILDRLRKKIISALEQEGGSDRKDGMDMSLCMYDKKTGTLEFAGANNPLIVASASGMLEVKADKMPVGAHGGEIVPFRTETINVNKGDVIYLLTDGYSDQFGGPREKKFSIKQLKEILAKIKGESLPVQRSILEQTLADWQGRVEQVDDISIIGIKI